MFCLFQGTLIFFFFKKEKLGQVFVVADSFPSVQVTLGSPMMLIQCLISLSGASALQW